MRHKPWAVVAALGAVFGGLSSPAWACGDKLLLLGRQIRFQSRHTPHAAVVLLYMPDSSRGALVDPKLESALTEAGHKLRMVGTKEELARAIQGGGFDVVLADLADANALQGTIPTSAGAPVFLPALYLFAPGHGPAKPQAKADTAQASKDFSTVLKVPSRPGQYCAAVDKAMELKLKRDRVKTHVKRSANE